MTMASIQLADVTTATQAPTAWATQVQAFAARTTGKLITVLETVKTSLPAFIAKSWAHVTTAATKASTWLTSLFTGARGYLAAVGTGLTAIGTGTLSWLAAGAILTTDRGSQWACTAVSFVGYGIARTAETLRVAGTKTLRKGLCAMVRLAGRISPARSGREVSRLSAAITTLVGGIDKVYDVTVNNMLILAQTTGAAISDKAIMMPATVQALARWLLFPAVTMIGLTVLVAPLVAGAFFTTVLGVALTIATMLFMVGRFLLFFAVFRVTYDITYHALDNAVELRRRIDNDDLDADVVQLTLPEPTPTPEPETAPSVDETAQVVERIDTVLDEAAAKAKGDAIMAEHRKANINTNSQKRRQRRNKAAASKARAPKAPAESKTA
jgi:hypothetical protein